MKKRRKEVHNTEGNGALSYDPFLLCTGKYHMSIRLAQFFIKL